MESVEKKDTNEYLDNLNLRLKEATDFKGKVMTERHNSIIGSLTSFIIVGIICFIIFSLWATSIIGSIIFYIFFFIDLLILIIVLSFFFNRRAIKQAQINIDLVNEEIELYNVRNEDERILADKQFKIHQKELKRYYDLNLSQIRFLSVLGIILIILGVVIIMGSITMYVLTKFDVWFFIISTISGVLIDGIGAFFISMYTENMKVAIALHSKLAGSNNLLLANLIVAKIENKELRENSLAEISKNISTNNKD